MTSLRARHDQWLRLALASALLVGCDSNAFAPPHGETKIVPQCGLDAHNIVDCSFYNTGYRDGSACFVIALVRSRMSLDETPRRESNADIARAKICSGPLKPGKSNQKKELLNFVDRRNRIIGVDVDEFCFSRNKETNACRIVIGEID